MRWIKSHFSKCHLIARWTFCNVNVNCYYNNNSRNTIKHAYKTTTIQIVFQLNLPFMFHYAKRMVFESAKITKFLDCSSRSSKRFSRNEMLRRTWMLYQRSTMLLEKPKLNVFKICDMQSVNVALEVAI